MELANKQVVITGIGRSALGATTLLRSHGAAVFISDAEDSPAARAWAAKAEALGATVELGQHSTDRFEGADLIVMSPGVPPYIAPVAAARAQGIPVIAELELGARFCDAPILAVTGTNGKTTTTELLVAMARACGRDVILAGNNKMPLSQAVVESPEAELVVLEVSSYQLETIDTLRPQAAAVLNLTPDHLGRHGDMAGYAAAKARLFMNQKPGDTAILNAEDPLVAALPVPPGVTRSSFSVSGSDQTGIWSDGDAIFEGERRIAFVSDCPLPGRHNLDNALAALALARAAGLEQPTCVAAMRDFRGVEHRIEHVALFKKVDWYNDSKSTNIDSLRVALESFSQPVVLIAGGRGKGAAYDVLADTVAEHVKHLVTIGEDGPAIARALGSAVPTTETHTMAEAVAAAASVATVGDVVLLSPGCASFDMYSDFEARGQDFKQCVQDLMSNRLAAANTGGSA